MKHIFPRIAFEQKLLGNLAKIKKIGGNQLLRGQKEVDKGSIESPQWVTRQRVDSMQNVHFLHSKGVGVGGQNRVKFSPHSC